MKERYLVLTIDTISELFKDYLTEEDLPSDAQPLKLVLNPANKLLGLEMEAPSWAEGLAPLRVAFDIKRVYGTS